MKLRAWAGRSGGLLLGGCLLDHAHDVGLLHDEEILAVDAHLGAGPLAEQHAVARLEIKRLHRAVLIASAWSDGDHLALLGLFLGGIGNDDPALGFLFAFSSPSMRRTTTQSCKGRNFIGASRVNLFGFKGNEAAERPGSKIPLPRG